LTEPKAAAGGSEAGKKGKKVVKEVEKEEEEEEEEEEEGEDYLNQELKEIGVAEVLARVTQDVAGKDETMREVLDAIWSRNRVNLRKGKEGWVKFQNPYNPRPIDDNKVKELMRHFQKTGIRPFVWGNSIEKANGFS